MGGHIGLHILCHDQLALHDRPVAGEGADELIGVLLGGRGEVEGFRFSNFDEFGGVKDARLVVELNADEAAELAGALKEVVG